MFTFSEDFGVFWVVARALLYGYTKVATQLLGGYLLVQVKRAHRQVCMCSSELQIQFIWKKKSQKTCVNKAVVRSMFSIEANHRFLEKLL